MNRNPEGLGDEKLDDDFGYQEGMQAKGRTHGRRPEVAGRSERKGPAMSPPGTDPAMSPGTAPATESIPRIRSTHHESSTNTRGGRGGGGGEELPLLMEKDPQPPRAPEERGQAQRTSAV